MGLKCPEICACCCKCMQCELCGLCTRNCCGILRVRETLVNYGKIKMQAENKLFLNDKFIKYMFLFLGIS